MTAAVIVAAGSSRRMGFDKLFAPLGPEPVIAHSIRAFRDHPDFGAVVVVGSAGNLERLQSLRTDITVVEGGSERCHSVWNGLCALPDDCEIVAVHDGARPLIHSEAIRAVLATARERGAASLARPITDTVKRADESGLVTSGVDREGLWAMETPQCFQFDLLRSAYQRVRERNEIVTDEVSVLEAESQPVFLVKNEFPNPKITFPADLVLAEKLLSLPSS